MTHDLGSVAVLGGAGYVGSVVSSALAQRKFKVTVVDSLLWNQIYVIDALKRNPQLNSIKANMAEIDRWNAGSDQLAAVVIAGALVGDPITKKYPDVAHQVNEIETRKVIDATISMGVPRLIFLSTCSNYGVVDNNLEATETTDLKPVSLYARQKVALERYIVETCADTETKPTVLRLSTAYGDSPRMRFDLTVGHFVRDAYESLSLSVFDCDTWRPYCHVEDIAQAVYLVCTAPDFVVADQVFNVGGSNGNFSKRHIAEIVQESFPDLKVDFVEGGEDLRNYRVSFQKIHETLGFLPKWSVEEYVPQLAQALREGKYPSFPSDPNRYGNYVI